MSRMDVVFLISVFRLYPGSKCHSSTIEFAKNLFPSACFCWDSRFSLGEADQNYKFDGTIGYGDSCLKFLLRHFKVLRLHALMQDAAGAVRAYSDESPGYCYLIGRGSNSSLLGHVTGLLFCLYVKLFAPSIFNSVDL